MSKFWKLMVLVAALALVVACGKKEAEQGKQAPEKAGKVEKVEKKEAPAAEEKAEAPAAEEKAAEPAAEEKAEAPAAEEKADEPAAEEKAEEPAAEEKADEPAAEEKAAEPAAEEKKEEAVDPHAASGENQLVATYEVGALDTTTVKQLTMALADFDGVVSAKADTEAGLFKVTYTSGCPHSMLSAIQTVASAAKLQGVAAAQGEAPKAGCGSCPHKNTCGGH